MSHDTQLLLDAARRAAQYLEHLDERGVAPGDEAVAALEGFDEPMPDDGAPSADVLARLDELGSPATAATNGRRFFGFVTGAVHPAALAAHVLSTAWDQPTFRRIGSPVAAKLEDVAGQWLLELFGLPEGTAFSFVTGATMANFTALAAARRALLLRQGWDVDAQGMFGAPEVRVVVSEETHPSVFKALGMLGFGRDRVERVPTDREGRMRPEALPSLDDMSIVCMQAGNVNSGAIDPLSEVTARANAAGAWAHVDGAFGMWAAAAPALRSLVEGMERADSWATDGHKWLNLPYDNAAVFVRDGSALAGAMSLRAPYLLSGGEREPSDYTPELSRRARGVDFWAALKALGRRGVAGLVERCCAHARLCAETLRKGGLDVLNEVVLNQVVVGLRDEAEAAAVAERIQREGRCWVGQTDWKGRAGLRLSFSSMHTTDADALEAAEAVLRAVSEIARRKQDVNRPEA